MAVTFVRADSKGGKKFQRHEHWVRMLDLKFSRISIGFNKYLVFFGVKDSHNGDIHPMKKYQNLLILEFIDGANKVENMQNKDTIRKNLLSFLKESISLKKIHIDGTDFCVNYEG